MKYIFDHKYCVILNHRLTIFVVCLFAALSSFQCNYSSIALTELEGIVAGYCEDAEFPTWIYFYEEYDFIRVVDSTTINADGSFYWAFSGADFVELRGTGQCASDWYRIRKGFVNNIKLEHRRLVPNLIVSTDLPQDLDYTAIRLRVIRLFPRGGGFESLVLDRNNVNKVFNGMTNLDPTDIWVVSGDRYLVEVSLRIGPNYKVIFNQEIDITDAHQEIIIR